VIAIASDNDHLIDEHADRLLRVPQASELFSPLLAIIPLQLVAYHTALARGCDIDQHAIWQNQLRSSSKSESVSALALRANAPSWLSCRGVRVIDLWAALRDLPASMNVRRAIVFPPP